MGSRRFLLTALAAGVTLIGGCSAPVEEAGAPETPSALTSGADCAKESLKLVKPGRMTIGTDKPAYPPWFVDDDPANGKGYESAVGYAVAEQLGFEKSEVDWVAVPFNSAVAPGPKSFDLDLNQISINDERRQAVDFSSGYYDVRQAVVTYSGSPIAQKKQVSELSGAKLGAQVGTTSYNAITEQIKPTTAPAVFDSNDLAVQALKNKQIDGVVVDLPTAFYMIGAQLDNGVIVGQLPASGGDTEQLGAVLDKGSSLTACVSAAVDALREDGTLSKLEQQWLQGQGAPELR
ncbi:ABC transporter substrate-binding protein [Gephyromycinifex aptenodytis]|uniref:ABC transporter substrate-binding protein n=1 Tax=Gephyromycinifex aptenodytis TaxID=2716227 RepID=UPI0014456F43|nr:ABC transporter substrate-binding protein [Gephyromycinifex aptenodytis]